MNKENSHVQDDEQQKRYQQLQEWKAKRAAQKTSAQKSNPKPAKPLVPTRSNTAQTKPVVRKLQPKPVQLATDSGQTEAAPSIGTPLTKPSILASKYAKDSPVTYVPPFTPPLVKTRASQWDSDTRYASGQLRKTRMEGAGIFTTPSKQNITAKLQEDVVLRDAAVEEAFSLREKAPDPGREEPDFERPSSNEKEGNEKEVLLHEQLNILSLNDSSSVNYDHSASTTPLKRSNQSDIPPASLNLNSSAFQSSEEIKPQPQDRLKHMKKVSDHNEHPDATLLAEQIKAFFSSHFTVMGDTKPKIQRYTGHRYILKVGDSTAGIYSRPSLLLFSPQDALDLSTLNRYASEAVFQIILDSAVDVFSLLM